MRVSISTSQWAILFVALCQFWPESDGRVIGSNVDWICEDAAPCVRAIRPHGGAAVVASNAVDYTLEVGVHRRQSEQDELVKKWSSLKYETTWSVEIQWYRLLETKMRVPLPNCRNILRCKVSLLGHDDVQLVGSDTSSTDFVYRHYLVEVRFQGHPSISSMELILRKDSQNSNSGPVRQETIIPGQNNNDAHPFVISDDIDDVKKHPKYDWLFNRKSNSRGANDVTSDDDKTGFQVQSDDVENYPNIVQAQYDVTGDADNKQTENRFTGGDIPDDYNGLDWKYDNIDSDTGSENPSRGVSMSGEVEKDDKSSLSAGGIVALCLFSAIIPIAIIALCCIRIQKRRRKQKTMIDNDFGARIHAKTTPRDSDRQSKRGRFARFFKPHPKKNFYPAPRHGPRNERTKKIGAKYERLNSDATDDEEVFPTDRSGLLDDSSKSRGQTQRDRIQMLREKSRLLRERATTVLTSARRKSGVMKDDVTKFAQRSGKRLVPILRRIWEWCVAFFRRCCGDNYRAPAAVPDTSDTSDTSDADAGTSTKITIGKSCPSPSSGKEKSFAPETDISGRFCVSTTPKGRGNRDDVMPTSSGLSPSVPITCSIHVPSKGNCGLHCLQRRPPEEPVTSSDTSSARSSDASATTSVTSIGSGVSENRRPRGNGDGPTVSNGPALPNVLLQTRASFRRENRRMQYLLRNWEERTKTHVTKSGVTSQRGRVVIGSRRSLSEDRFMRIGGEQDKKESCPPKLLTRRKRISRVITAEKTLNQSTNAVDSSGCNKEQSKKLHQTPSSKSPKYASSQTTSSSPSSGDDVYEMTSQESEVTNRSVEINVTNTCDVTNNRNASKVNHALVSTSVASQLDDVKESDVTERCRATEMLRSAAHALLASDDDDVMVASDDEFWKDVTSSRRC